MSINITSNTIISTTWTNFKSTVDGNKNLLIQYDDDGITYTIYAFDDIIAYTTIIWKNIVPETVIAGGYSQSQNDADKVDFESNYKLSANNRISEISNQISVIYNGTVSSNGSKSFKCLGQKQINLFVNITQSPTGTNPTLQFAIQEVDPGDLTTVIGSSSTSTVINSIGAQRLNIDLTASSAVKVSWTISGASANFNGVYVTMTLKSSNISMGIDSNGNAIPLKLDSNGATSSVSSTNILKSQEFTITQRAELQISSFNYTVTTGKSLYLSYFGATYFGPANQNTLTRLKVNGTTKMLIVAPEQSGIALPLVSKIADSGDQITITVESQVPKGTAWACFTAYEA